MDKNAIKKYAVWARRELIEKVTQKAQQYGIEDGKELDENLDSINGTILTEDEKKQRKALIKKVINEGFNQVMEEVAYTWFNRFIALRFMEINGYIPNHVRVFTDDNNRFNPQILSEALHIELDGLDKEKVYEMKMENQDEELFKYLLIVLCNDLNSILPKMFQKLADYTELLLPDYLLREGSVIEKLVSDIPQNDFDVSSDGGQIEIIGWFYQYYNDEKKASVIDMAGKAAVKKEDIPAATQLFTTDWIVRFIVDNSLGRYWIEHTPNSSLSKELEYYTAKNQNNEKKTGVVTGVDPTDITFFDPCMGSGHFLLYAFELFMNIYKEYGYSSKEAVTNIVTKNIYGLDIDERASQLAYFSIMMKARQYDRRFFEKKVQPNVYEILESSQVNKDLITYISSKDVEAGNAINRICLAMENAKEYGSLVEVQGVNYEDLYSRLELFLQEPSLFNRGIEIELIPFIKASEILTQKYTVVATNPPYLNRMNESLKFYISKKYKDYWTDLFSVFMVRNFDFCKPDGYSGFMTPFVWMFIRAYEKLRKYIINNKSIVTLIQFEYSAYEEATVPICCFVLQNTKDRNIGEYFKLSDFKGGMEIQKKKVLEAINAGDSCSYYFKKNILDFKSITGYPLAFWAPKRVEEIFENSKPFSDYATIRVGMHTGNNEIFLREWYEVNINNICFECKSHDESVTRDEKWYPYNKGGGTRKWYGYRTKVVNWQHGGVDIHKFHNLPMTYNGAPVRAKSLQFRESITWSDIGSTGNFGCRYTEPGAMFDVKGSSAFVNDRDNLEYAMAFLNSNMVSYLLQMLNPTISYQVGNISALPFELPETEDMERIKSNVLKCIENEKEDWNSYEISWEFQKNPLIISGVSKIEEAWEKLKRHREDIRNSELELETNNNEIIMKLYGVDNVGTTPSNDIFIRKAELKEDIIEFISYFVGCAFGRYSLDKPGLICAGNDINSDDYVKYPADNDNIIPICDDEYFEDDIVERLIQFVKAVYGEETLEENLGFIAEALGGNGSAREVIRYYFINDFYDDHLKIYQKRPIYWLFDSGKKNGFKCLIYMHRYQPDTIARIRTDYVHEQQARYRTAIEETEKRIESASGSDKVKLTKKLNTLKAQDEEIHAYEEKIHHLADQMISIDLDDGVKHNYEIFKDVLAKVK